MKHSFIAPTRLLRQMPDECDYHLMLAHLMENREYTEFYRERSERGDFIIVDNGAFENGVPYTLQQISELCTAANIVPAVVVAPDYPYKDYRITLEAAIKANVEVEKWFDVERTQLMVVPQSVEGDWAGWVKCHNIAAQLSNVYMIGLSIIGMPNAFCSLTMTKDISFNRQFGINMLKKSGYFDQALQCATEYHALGCGSPREIALLANQGIYGNDSSSAIWHAVQGIEYDSTVSGLVHGKSKVEVDFDLEPIITDDLVAKIRFNCDWITRLLG